MGANTTYKVDIVYDLKGSAAKGLRGIASEAKSTSDALGGLKKAAAVVAGAFTIRAGYDAFIGYNSRMEASVTSLATTMYGFGKAKTFDDAIAQSTEMVDKYRVVAKDSIGETSDFVSMHQSVQGVLLQTGMSMKDVTEVTIGATAASQLMGEQAEMTALDIKQMAMGSMTARDRVGGMLVGMLGASKGMKLGFQEWNTMVKKHPDQMKKMLLEAVNGEALKKAAAKMGQTFEGRLSTLKDNLALFGSRAGKTMFDSLSKGLGDVNGWFDKNKSKVDAWADSLGRGLASAFTIVKDAVSFLADHASLLITVGKVWLAVKVAGAVGNTVGGLGALGGGAGGGGGGGIMGYLNGLRGGGDWRGRGAQVSGPMTAAQSLTGSGLGRVGGAGGVMSGGLAQAAGGILSAATAGYALGTILEENTGIGKKFGTELAKATGRFNHLDQQAADTTISLKGIDAIFAAAAARVGKKEGARGTIQYTQADETASALNDAARLLAGYQTGLDNIGKGGVVKDMARGMFRDTSGIRDALLATGKVSEADASKVKWGSDKDRLAILDKLNAKTEQVSVGAETEANLADSTVKTSMGKLTDAQKAQVDQNKLLTDAMQALKDNIHLLNSPGSFESLTDDLAEKQLAEKKAEADKLNPPGGRSTNVTINKIEVASNDPDRFVMGAVRSFAEINRNPVRADVGGGMERALNS